MAHGRSMRWLLVRIHQLPAESRLWRLLADDQEQAEADDLDALDAELGVTRE